MSWKWKPWKVFLGRQIVLIVTWASHQALRGKWLNFLAQQGGGLPEKVPHLFLLHDSPTPLLPSLSKQKKQGSRSARLSPQSMIHCARKVFKCSIRIVQSFTIL